MEYLKLTELDSSQQKPYGSDKMNNFAINTEGFNQDGKKYTELLSYWNLYHVDEAVRTKWIFYTYIDNLSFLGGLLDISLMIPSFLMIGYTFRLNEINVFFY